MKLDSKIREEDDIVIGRIPSVKMESLMEHIAKRLKKDPVAFFNLQY